MLPVTFLDAVIELTEIAIADVFTLGTCFEACNLKGRNVKVQGTANLVTIILTYLDTSCFIRILIA